MSYNHLMVFVKKPILGQVKTRISNTIGNELALKIYQYLMQKTFDVCCDIDCQKYVFYSDFIINDDMWSRADFFKSFQVGTNLGKRMAQAFASVISNKPKNKGARARLADAEAALVAKTRAAARATDAYVHESPWTAIGIAAGVGLVLGVILGRR